MVGTVELCAGDTRILWWGHQNSVVGIVELCVGDTRTLWWGSRTLSWEEQNSVGGGGVPELCSGDSRTLC